MPTHKQEAKAKAYHAVFSSNAGQLVLEDLAAKCFCLSTTFSSQAGVIEYNEGRRSVYLDILAQLAKAEKGNRNE